MEEKSPAFSRSKNDNSMSLATPSPSSHQYFLPVLNEERMRYKYTLSPGGMFNHWGAFKAVGLRGSNPAPQIIAQSDGWPCSFVFIFVFVPHLAVLRNHLWQDWGTICGTLGWTKVVCMYGKHPTYCTIALAPSCSESRRMSATDFCRGSVLTYFLAKEVKLGKNKEKISPKDMDKENRPLPIFQTD